MRLLYLHADDFSYSTVKEAVKNPPDPPGSASFGECLVVFTSIEEGDGEDSIRNAANDIVSHASKLGVGTIVLYPYAHLSPRLEKPLRAHKILKKLESSVSSTFEGEVHRAPFGWYKSFKISCKGHPLAELSREFRESRFTHIPWPRSKKGGPSIEIMERMGLLPREQGLVPASWAWEAYHSSSRVLAKTLTGAPPRIVSTAPSLSDALELCISSAEPILALGPSPGDAVVGPFTLSPGDAVVRAVSALTRNAVSVLDVAVNDGIIKSSVEGSEGIVVGGLGEGKTCIGPLSNVYRLAIHALLERVRAEGITPFLEFWSMPVGLAVIPVSPSEVEFAEDVARRAASLGARSLIIEGQGLGRRIREAGRMWIPLVAVVGPREVETGTVTLRRRWEPGKQETVTVGELLEEVGNLSRGGGDLARVSI